MPDKHAADDRDSFFPDAAIVKQESVRHGAADDDYCHRVDLPEHFGASSADGKGGKTARPRA